jgi:hypothetical protein
LRPVKIREGEAQTDYFGETTAGLALRITRSGAPRLAAGCFSDVVAGEHMTFAGDWVRASDATLWDGVTEYMEEEKLEFDELCREIIRRIRHAGGTMKERDIKRQLPRQCSFQERPRQGPATSRRDRTSGTSPRANRRPAFDQLQPTGADEMIRERRRRPYPEAGMENPFGTFGTAKRGEVYPQNQGHP